MRKPIHLSIAALGLALTCAPLAAGAATLPAPTASYDATMTIDAGNNHFTSTVVAIGAKERRTADVNGLPQTVLVNRATGKVYLLIPAFKAAMEITAAQTGVDITQLDRLPVTAEGQEPVSGVITTRYAVNGQAVGGSFNGHVWATDSGIIMRVDGIAQHGDQSIPTKILVTDLHQRAENSAMVDLPAGVRVLPANTAAMLQGQGLPAIK